MSIKGFSPSRDAYIGVGTMLVGAIALWDLGRTPPRRFGMAVLSSTDYPTAIAWILLGLGSLVVATELLNGLSKRRVTPADTGATSVAPTFHRSAQLLGATFIFLVLISVLGFYLSAALYLAVLIASALDAIPLANRLGMALAISLLTVGTTYVIFDLWLNYFLPRGLIW